MQPYMFDRRWVKPALFVLLGVIVLGLLGHLIVSRAVPGDAFYSMKVNYVEEGVETFLRFTPELEAKYHVMLLERRFKELRTLAERGEISEGDVWYLYDETAERAKELVAHLAAEDGLGLTNEEALMYNHRMTTALRAMEVVTEEQDILAFLEEDIEDERREAENMLDTRAEQFTAHASDDRVKQFISDILGEVLAAVESRDLERRLQNRVEDRLEDTEREITEGDGANAIGEIMHALRLVQIADYFGRAEAELTPEEETDADEEEASEAEDEEASATGTASGTQRIEADGEVIEVRGAPEGAAVDPE